MALHDDDAVLNTAGERPFSELVASRLSRRDVLGGGMASAAAFPAGGRLLGGVAGAAPGARGRARGNGRGRRPGELLGFSAIPLGYDDEVHVPPGYGHAVHPVGHAHPRQLPRVRAGPPPLVPGGNTAAHQAEQTGMHHDGMHYFPLHRGPAGSERGLLVVNHEYTDEGYLHTGTPSQPDKAAWTADMVRKSQNAHGVSVVEIARNRGGWEVVRSRLNRRITANTAMSFSGPAAGHRLVRTSVDPAGRTPLGTINNCAHGFSPWGTYLTCEENFNGYFRLDPAPTKPSTPPSTAATAWAATASTGRPTTTASSSAPATPTRPTASGGWWRSTRSTRPRRRSSAPPSDASSTRAPSCTWARGAG